jgi:ADP-ribose pyrophosphatase YjhB (NUDIX family)
MMMSIASSSHPRPVVVVAVHGRICEFGECIRSSLLKNNSAEESDDLVRVHVELTPTILNLTLDSKNGISFEHAPHCPAFEFASPRSDGHIRVGVATVLERNGWVLLTRRHSKLRSFPDVWVVPGGHIEGTETLAETAKRELFEETGLREGIHCMPNLLGVWESCFPHRASIGPMTRHHAVCYVHAVATTAEELHVQRSEVQSIAWLNRSQVDALLQADENQLIDVHQAEEDCFNLPNVPSRDAWHDERARVSPTTQAQTAKWFLENMTAGTRFALRLWLEKSTATL